MSNNVYNITYCGVAVAVEWLRWKHTEQTPCSGVPLHIKCFA